jgi:hypothetical protein
MTPQELPLFTFLIESDIDDARGYGHTGVLIPFNQMSPNSMPLDTGFFLLRRR